MANGQHMLSVDELKLKMARGGSYFLAADEQLLARLPPGNWIGGTIPYFMTEQGGIHTKDKVYALKLPPYITGVEIKRGDILTFPEDGFNAAGVAVNGKSRNFARYIEETR